MPSTTPDFHQKSFRIIRDDDKFFTRLLSKENSKSNSSFRVYYGDVSSAVPFTWETRPGTPKHENHENPVIPPLTPPPSYYTNNNHNNFKKQKSRSKLFLHTLLRRMNPKKSHLASFPSSSSPSPSPARCSFHDPMMSTPSTYVNRRRRISSWGGESAMDDHQVEACHSRLYVGIGKDKEKRLRGGYFSVCIMKKAFLSIVGHRSA